MPFFNTILMDQPQHAHGKSVKNNHQLSHGFTVNTTSTPPQSNPYRLELDFATSGLESSSQSEQLQPQLASVHMNSPPPRALGSSLRSSHVNSSAVYACNSDSQKREKLSIAPTSSSLGPSSLHLQLDLESNDSFSAELEALLSDSKTASDPSVSAIESTQSDTLSQSSSITEPCHTIIKQTNILNITLSSPSIERGTIVDFGTAQFSRSDARSAKVTPASTNAISTNSAGYAAAYSPIVTPSKTTMSQRVDQLPTVSAATTIATAFESTSSSKGQPFPLISSSFSSPSSSSSSSSFPTSSLVNSRLNTQHDSNPLQQNQNKLIISSIPQTTSITNTTASATTPTTCTTTTTTTTPTIHIMSYPSPPLQSAALPIADKDIHESDVVSSIEIHTIDISQPQPKHFATSTVSYTTITDSDQVDEDNSSPSPASLSDCAPSSPHVSSSPSSSSSPPPPPENGIQLQDGVVSGLKKSVAALQITSEDDFLMPIPQKSEDWAALVDTPASPTHAQYPGMMPKPMYGTEGYTDSPAPEEGAYGYQGDYMQHVSQQQYYPSQYYYQPQLQQQYHHNFPYQHQHHNSTSSVPLVHHNGMGSGDSFSSADIKAYRKSWSASETMSGAGYNSFGYLTPPRHPDDLHNRSRPGSSLGMRQPHTSVSLLTDAAILAKYRDTAIKTNDPSIQLSYAKYLLEIGEVPSPNASTSSSSPSPSADIGTPRPSFASFSNNNTPPTSAPPSPTSAQHDTESGKKQLTQEAIYWIDRLAKEGQSEAQFIRATWYEDGLYYSKRNLDKALRWYQSASRGDYGPAHYKVAYFCEKKRDNSKAVMLYKKAAVHNEAPANHRLAMIYLNGELGQSKNMKVGLEYLKRAAAFATESAPKSPYVLGLILAREYGDQLAIPDDIAFPDDGEALEWFRKSAHLGYGPANYKLGYCYEYGSLGCTIDPFLSVHHYERAVLAGDSKGEAEMALSGWHLSGAENCFQADEQLAFKYASIAAEKGLAKAQYAMGYYHEVGISVPTDMEKAMEFYKLAAANGNKDAIKRLEDQSAGHDKLAHKKSIKKMKQNRKTKRETSCNIM